MRLDLIIRGFGSREDGVWDTDLFDGNAYSGSSDDYRGDYSDIEIDNEGTVHIGYRYTLSMSVRHARYGFP